MVREDFIANLGCSERAHYISAWPEVLTGGHLIPLATNVTIMPTQPAAAMHRDWLVRLRRRCVNVLVGILFLMMLLQGMPLNMNAATNGVKWLGDWVGAGHYGWSMFAPDPDRQNHRISAEVMDSDDHVLAEWKMPDWRELSSAERFRLHRWNEYYDNVWMNQNNRCWPALAQHVVRSTKLPPALEAPPQQVRLIAETKTIPHPRSKPGEPPAKRWPKPGPPEGYDDRWVLSIEQLP